MQNQVNLKEFKMKYPYIGTDGANTFIFYAKDTATLIGDNGNCFSSGFKITVDESKFKNITCEYLANTYGKVESKEHAEFIVKLAKGAGFAIDICNLEGRKFFCFYGDVLLFSEQYDSNKKLITIPLPPKKVETKEWPTKITLEEHQNKMRLLNCRCSLNDSEWPQVGDNVAWSPKLSRKGTLLNIYEGMAWVKDSYGEFVSIEARKLQKPKTPEEELRDEIAFLLDSYVDSEKPRGYFVGKIIEITNKKPQ